MINAVPSNQSFNASAMFTGITPGQTASTSESGSLPKTPITPATETAPPSSNPPSKKGPARFSPKMIIGGILLVLLVVGSGVGLYLSQQTQDLRQDASGGIRCGTITCNDGRTAGKDCSAPQSTCEQRANEFCGSVGYQSLGSAPTEAECSAAASNPCSSCTASCSGTSCTASCPATVTQCTTGKNTFFCSGKSNSGCNELHGNYIASLSNTSGSVGTITPEKWCTTVQIDAWVRNGNTVSPTDARVVYIGDGGEICVEGTGCDPNALDWDCSKEAAAGSFSIACQPPKPNQTPGDLRYRLQVSNTAPKNFGSVVFFMGFNGTQANIKELTDDFLGKPTWSNTCVGESWCGYWIHEKADAEPSVSGNAVYFDWTGSHPVGPNNKTINDLVTKIEQMKAAGKLPQNYQVMMHAELRLPNGDRYKFEDQGILRADLSRYACSAEKPTGSFSAVCTPGQAYSPDGSKLSYDLTVSNVNPSTNFERAITFISFYRNDLTQAQATSFEATFGKPTWASNGANPTCVNTDWCGYWLTSRYSHSSAMKMTWNDAVAIGGSAGSKTIKDLVAWGAANNITSFKVESTTTVNGATSDILGTQSLAIRANACAQEPAKLVCGAQGCTTDTDCTAGLKCVAAQNGNRYCAQPAQEARCGASPSTTNCCQAPKCNSYCTTNEQCTTALGSQYSCVSNNCRLTENPTSEKCEPVAPIACNAVCTSDLQCQKVNSKHRCLSTGNNGTMRCRHVDYPEQADCDKPAPVCLSISSSNSSPKINDSVNFTCAQVADVSQYEFRVIEPDGNIVALTATNNQSGAYTISTHGTYRAECRLCPGGSSECQPWPASSAN